MMISVPLGEKHWEKGSLNEVVAAVYDWLYNNTTLPWFLGVDDKNLEGFSIRLPDGTTCDPDKLEAEAAIIKLRWG